MGGRLLVGREQARTHEQAGEEQMRLAQILFHPTRTRQFGDGRSEVGGQRDPVAQLQEMDEEFEIDQPAAQQLGIERALGMLMRRHLAAHAENILA